MSEIDGWDVGGAHLKRARLGADGRLLAVDIWPTPLWRGLDQLETALDEALAAGRAAQSAVTMTAELVDLFPDRETGVAQLLAVLQARLGAFRIFSLDGLVERAPPERIASANWLATARWAAMALGDGVLVDIGSTTTDLVPLVGGQPDHEGTTDAERLAEDELIYTGVARTPVMAVAMAAPFDGRWQGLMAELFASMADVHRLAGGLPAGADLHPTADGGPKTAAASGRRLLRMVGRDWRPELMPATRDLARFLADAQLQSIERALARLLSRGRVPQQAPVIGAGVGRFVVRRLARRQGRRYVDIGPALAGGKTLARAAGNCAPAIAVARLLAAATNR